jgi:ABC-type branched-subunit amino acid transport system ATPase component/branched-subunit amino acid ABC-type transport system permease component
MSSMLPYIVTGLVAGSIYSLGGIGLVLTYKTSRIFNLAQGAISTISAYVFYYLFAQEHLPWPIAGLISVVGVGVVLGLLFEPLARKLSRSTLAARVVAMVGILIAVQAFFTILYGPTVRLFPSFLSNRSYAIGHANVSVTDIVICSLAFCVTVALYVFFRTARLGVAMRGVVDDSDLLSLSGTSPKAVRRWAWILGCNLAAVAGVLLAPSLNLDAETLSLLVVEAFGAAAIGAFTSIPITYAGGLAIGVIGAIVTEYAPTSNIYLTGLSPSLPFIVLFIVMIAMPRRWLATTPVVIAKRSAWKAPAKTQLLAAVAVIAFLLFVPTFVGSQLLQWTVALAYVIIFLSLGLLVRTSGQISLCQITFVAIGSAVLGHLGATGAGWPWPVAVLFAGLIVAPIGAILAIPAIRLGGLYLALATFGFGLLVESMFYSSPLLFGPTGITVPVPHLGWLDVGSTRGFYYVVLLITFLAAIVVVAINRSRVGRLLRAMVDSPVALSTNGTSVNMLRILVFAIAAFLAGVAGALIGATNTLAVSDSYDSFISLTLVALVFISVGGEPWYALIAAGGFVLIPAYFTSADTAYVLQIIFGAFAVFVALGLQQPAPEAVKRVSNAIAGLIPSRKQPPRPAGADRTELLIPERPSGSLEVQDLRVAFGGLVAVDTLDLEAPVGRITGLIGPNGAGKTTTFNACCGLISVDKGAIHLNGRDITRLSAASRARLGIGRTFQQMELFDSLSVIENVAIGREASMAGANPITQIVAKSSDGAVIDDAVEAAIDLCGISALATTTAGSLSTGQRRLVELARCLAGPFHILLLDEPSSGLDRIETAHFGEILRGVVAKRGVGILLVEHDMSLVMEVCDYIYVLDFGVPIFNGSPIEVSSSELVQAAYLGTEESVGIMLEVEH